MSLATTGGGLGGAGAASGGLSLAHNAHAAGRVAPPSQRQHATAGGAAAPPSAAALGADLVDKSQGLTLRNVRNTQHLPIVAVDLHGAAAAAAAGTAGGGAHVAYFPKKPEDPSKGVPPVPVQPLVPTTLHLVATEAANKTLRKYLSKTKTFGTLRSEVLLPSSAPPLSAPSSSRVALDKPHLWLGLRRVEDAPAFVRESVTIDDSTGPAISEEASGTAVGVTVANSTLDGSPVQHDDYDRVVFKVRLHPSKKAVTVFPEEAVEMILHQARYAVAVKVKPPLLVESPKNKKKKNGGTNKSSDSNDNSSSDSEDDILACPCAIAVPAWACHDAAVEALHEAAGAAGCVVQRNVAALAGALLPSIDGRVTPLLERMNYVRAGLQKEHQKRALQAGGAAATAVFEDAITLVVIGMTAEGMEATVVQVSQANLSNISCLFGEFKVISNVAQLDVNPLSCMRQCTRELEEAVDAIAPEMDGPAGIVLIGSTTDEQKKMTAQWNRVKNEEWSQAPVFMTDPDCVAKGAAVLGAVSHGRLSTISQDSSSGSKKSRAELGLRVQNVAPCAVAIRYNYHGRKDPQWTDTKVLFDFDRQIPAGPHSMDCNAAECVVHRNASNNGTTLSEEDFLRETKKYEGAKGIPQREAAALDFQIQVLQKWTRDGEWIKVGDPIEPLVKSEDDDKQTRVACESVVLELSLGVTGLITRALVGERESVAIATKSARNSAIRYYAGILFAILFFGGFFVKSYWDDYVLNRDAERLLLFYKYNVPGSYNDGDEHHARYTCYKYRSKKDKLWRNLEKKYGVPVLQAHEYKALLSEQPDIGEEEEETVDLDDKEEEKPEEGQEAPDL